MIGPVRNYVEAVELGWPEFDTAEDRERVARFREAEARLARAFTALDPPTP